MRSLFPRLRGALAGAAGAGARHANAFAGAAGRKVAAGCAWSAAAGVRHPRATLGVAVVSALVTAVVALGLRPSASPALLVDPDSRVGQATRDQEQGFGAEPILVLVEGDLNSTLSAANLVALVTFEGEAARLPGVRTVFGPGTFVNQTVVQIERVIGRELGPAAERADRAARRAERRARAEGLPPEQQMARAEAARLRALGPLRDQYATLFVRYGYVGLPSLANEDFVAALVFGSGTEPKRRFRWLFPDGNHALVFVRPDAGLSDGQARELGDRLDALAQRAGLQGVRLRVAGAPLVAASVAREVRVELIRLAPVAILGMVLALLLGLRGRLSTVRLLLPAAGAVLVTAALARPLGLGLTPATVAALSIVLGLAVDYAVQLQVRYSSGRSRGLPPEQAAVAAMRALGPVLVLAGVAMALGFMALTLSPVVLVDRLGQTLALGTLVSLAIVLAFAAPLLCAIERPGGRSPQVRVPPRVLGLVRGRRGIAVAAVACAGIALSGQTSVESDLTKLAPDGLPEVERVEALQRELGTSGQLRIAIEARDVTDPRVLAWMKQLQERVLALDERLQPGPNVAELLASSTGGSVPDRAAVGRLLRLVPPYFLDAVIARDRTRAELAFGVPLVPVAEQARLLERVEHLLAGAPPGVKAAPAGLVATAADSVRGLEAGRPWLLLIASALVFLVLLAARRDLVQAALPLVPALLAAGLVSLAVLALGLRLSPLSAALEPLVLAVGVEFGLLLDVRYRDGRRAGLGPVAARDAAVRTVGAAVLVSAATVALGFFALVASRLEVLQHFGALAALELALAAATAVAVVPALAAQLDGRRVRAARADRDPSTPPPSVTASAGC